MLIVLFNFLLLFMVVSGVKIPMLLPCASAQWGTMPQKTSSLPQLLLGHVDICPVLLLVVCLFLQLFMNTLLHSKYYRFTIMKLGYRTYYFKFHIITFLATHQFAM